MTLARVYNILLILGMILLSWYICSSKTQSAIAAVQRYNVLLALSILIAKYEFRQYQPRAISPNLMLTKLPAINMVLYY